MFQRAKSEVLKKGWWLYFITV